MTLYVDNRGFINISIPLILLFFSYLIITQFLLHSGQQPCTKWIQQALELFGNFLRSLCYRFPNYWYRIKNWIMNYREHVKIQKYSRYRNKMLSYSMGNLSEEALLWFWSTLRGLNVNVLHHTFVFCYNLYFFFRI